jgi:TPR repeat protein
MKRAQALSPRRLLWLILALLALASGWWASSTGSNGDSAATESGAGEGKAIPPDREPKADPDAGRRAAAPALPRLEVPELARRAEAGELTAQFELARVLLGCANYVEIERALIEEQAIDVAAEDHPLLALYTLGQRNEQAVQLILDLDSLGRELCEGRELPPQPTRFVEGQKWLDHAAIAGLPPAQLAWVEQFRARWRDRPEIVEKAEQVRTERERARSYLALALAAREPDALLQQAIAHLHGDLAAVEPMLAYAYWRAWRQSATQRPQLQSLVGMGESSYRRGLSEEQINQAEAVAKRLAREVRP